MLQSVLITAMGAWFLAIGAGLVLIRDAEQRVGEVLHSTRLTVREYVWGSFTGAVVAFLVIWGLFLGASMGFNHLLATGADSPQIGPFVPGNYLIPALLLGLPQIVFFAGVPFFLGAWTRRPIVVFAFPVATLLVILGFLVSWSPSWLDPAINRALMLADPSGFRWLNETFLKLDRGLDFYNTAPLPPDTGFLLSRIALAGAGLLAVEAAARNTARRLLRGDTDSLVIGFRRGRREAPSAVAQAAPVSSGRTLGELAMRTDPPGFLDRGNRDRPGRGSGTDGSRGYVPLRPADPLPVRQPGALRARTVRFAAAPDLGSDGGAPVQHPEPARLRPAPLLHRGVADEGAGAAVCRDLSHHARRDGSHAPRQDGRQRGGGGGDSGRGPDRIRRGHHRAAGARRSRRLRPLAVSSRRGAG